MAKYKAFNINWDVDNDEEIIASLPTELTINVDDSITNEEEVSNEISNLISDETGFCHYGFEYKKL